jgi:hypothetical protein
MSSDAPASPERPMSPKHEASLFGLFYRNQARILNAGGDPSAACLDGEHCILLFDQWGEDDFCQHDWELTQHFWQEVCICSAK